MSEVRQGPGEVEALIGLLHEVSEGLTRLATEMASAAGSHPTDLHAVSVISRHDQAPLTIGDLQSRMGLSPAATTALVDRLEASGHVQRVRDARDRRRVYLHATEHAHDTAMSLLQGFLDELRAALATYDRDELAAAGRVLADVRDTLATRQA
jgi:DNA-binding MarR family transcriptional regulator